MIIPMKPTENRDENREEYIAVALHHLRTPLIGTDWALKMMLHGDMGPLTDEQKAYITKCYDGNKRALNFISDILTVDKLERDAMGYSFTDISVGKMLDSALKESELEISEKKLHLIVNKDLNIPSIQGDDRKLFIVIENLIQNAIKYTPAGGTITVDVHAKCAELTLSVKDTGIGIPNHEKIHIFSRFFRASNAQTLHEEGSGVGLFMSKNIVEKHGGKMWFESNEGEGSTFFLRLPVKSSH